MVILFIASGLVFGVWTRVGCFVYLRLLLLAGITGVYVVLCLAVCTRVVALTLFSVFVLAILLVCRGFCVECGFTLVPLWVCLFVLVVGAGRCLYCY